MNDRIPPGGDRPIIDRLPDGSFDEMALLVWRIGELAMGPLLENPMPPSTINSTVVRIGHLSLDLSFDFVLDLERNDAQPTTYRVTVSEREPFPGYEEAEALHWRRFNLNLLNQRQTFERGSNIITPQGEIQLSDTSPLQGEQPKGPLAWRLATVLEMTCDIDEYYEFMDQLTSIYIHLSTAEY